MKNLRYALLLAFLAVAAGVGACSDTARNANPASPTMDCRGGYLGGGGGKQQDSTGVCPTYSPPADSL